MQFILGMLTMWMILSIFIYNVTFHTKQTTNWDDWFYWIVCFPLFLVGFPFCLFIEACQMVRDWILFNWEQDWRWCWENIKEKFHFWY